MIGGISNCLLGLPLGDGRGKDGLGLIGHASAIQDRALKPAACASIRQIEPFRVLPLRAEQIARQDDLRMRRAGKTPCLGDRIGDQLLNGNSFVHKLMDEGRIGAVLQ